MQKLNIYGDNILECEEALKLLTSSLELELIPVDGPLYIPTFTLKNEKETLFEIRLFPGYDRWEYNVKKAISSLGGKLREATDAVITKISEKEGKELPILAMEFSGALPAGNNAWQRSGRALSCAESGIPYLYFAELGGVELAAERVIRASRFPNPLVPFAYLALGNRYNSVTLPIYQPSPSISLELFKAYEPYFAGQEVNDFIKSIILNKADLKAKEIIENKALKLTSFLASTRRDSSAILSPNEWESFYKLRKSSEIAEWLIRKGMSWRKRVSIPTTPTFRSLLSAVSSLNVNAVGSADMPFCLLSSTERGKLVKIIVDLYGNKISEDFLNWLKSEKPLFISWVAGFKPRGDDSRPDRGLVPLLRMVVGEDDVDVLTVVYGPASQGMLSRLKNDMWALARDNGLWQAVINYSDGILVDTPNSNLSTIGIKIDNSPLLPSQSELTPSNSIVPIRFGEHDVDTVLHELFFLHKDEAFFEGLCNPPGGNWSGISLYNFNDGLEIRWVSLPRVSGIEAKRPDHLFQITDTKDSSNILTVESKDTASSVEQNIGIRLKKYITELIKVAPNVYRTKDIVTWQTFTKEYLTPNVKIFSVAAFRLNSLEELSRVKQESETDIVIGVEFLNDGHVVLHLILGENSKWLESFLNGRIQHFSGWLKIQIH